MKRILSILLILVTADIAFASFIQGIDIDFVTIGNPGNPADTCDAYACGAVNYEFRIGTYEITNSQWNTFTAVAGAPSGTDDGYSYNVVYTESLQPVNCVSWYEAAQFCNYLTSGNKSRGAYQFSGDNTNPGSFLAVDRAAALTAYGTVYCLPTEDEWYKAAYLNPSGSGYSLYTNGQDTIPAADNGWNYSKGIYTMPWNVGTGTEEQNGTFDMMGNIWEWNETAIYASRRIRGGSYYSSSSHLASSYRIEDGPYHEGYDMGFRIVIIPEPCSAMLIALGGLILPRQKKL